MDNSPKDIGAQRYTTDDVGPAGKPLSDLNGIYKKDYFKLSTVVSGDDVFIKKYESGMIKVELSNLSPLTILPQIPLDVMLSYFESEKTREDLVEMFGNIEKRKQKQIDKQHTKKNKNEQDLFKAEQKPILNPKGLTFEEAKKEWDANLAAELKNTAYQGYFGKDAPLPESQIVKPKEVKDELGGLFSTSNKSIKQAGRCDTTFSNPSTVSYGHANGKATAWKKGKAPKKKKIINVKPPEIIPQPLVLIIDEDKTDIKEKVEEKSGIIPSLTEQERVGSSVQKHVASRKKNKIEFSDNVLNMP